MKQLLFGIGILLAVQTSIFSQKTLNAYIFLAEECPISIFMAKPLKDAMETYGDRVRFITVYPNIKSNQSTARQFLNQHELEGFEVVLDPKQQLTAELGATITPEVVITDTEHTVLYRGRISNAYRAPGRMKHGTRINELKVFLNRILRGEEIPMPWNHAVGCYITFHDQ